MKKLILIVMMMIFTLSLFCYEKDIPEWYTVFLYSGKIIYTKTIILDKNDNIVIQKIGSWGSLILPSYAIQYIELDNGTNRTNVTSTYVRRRGNRPILTANTTNINPQPILNGVGVSTNISSFSVDIYIHNLYVTIIHSYPLKHGYPIDGSQNHYQEGYTLGYIKYQDNGLMYKIGAGPIWFTKIIKYHDYPFADREVMRLNINAGVGGLIFDDQKLFLLFNCNISKISSIGLSLGLLF